MSNKIVQPSGNSEVSRNVDTSDNNDPNDIISEKVNLQKKSVLKLFNCQFSELQ